MDHTNSGLERLAGYARPLAKLSRYLAYSSDVGESVRPLVNKRFVNGAYGVAFVYVGWDIYHQSKKTFDETGDMNATLKTAAETTIFQGLASLLIPSVSIHSGVKYSKELCKVMTKEMKGPLKYRIMRFTPTLTGLAMIPLMPLIDEPIEEMVHYVFRD